VKNEIKLYHPNDQPDFNLEVRVGYETFLLSHDQMLGLFDSTKKGGISKTSLTREA
jgi:hypothetical protein